MSEHQYEPISGSVLGIATALTLQGLSVVPVAHESKRPSVDWKQYQQEIAGEDALKEWFDQDEQGLGIVCGKVSGNLVCLDFDDLAAFEHFAQLVNLKIGNIGNEDSITLPIAETSRGRHVFFRTPSPVPSKDLYLDGYESKAGDLISQGKFVVLPPTRHPNGTARKWITPFGTHIPVFRLDRLGIAKKPDFEASEFVHEGSRHSTLVKAASRLVSAYPSLEKLAAVLQEINLERCQPPLPVHEVQAIAQYMTEDRLDGNHSYKDIGMCEQGTGLDSFIQSYVSKGNEERFANVFQAAPEYLREQVENPVTWLVEKMLPDSYLVVLGATSKSGKSCLVSFLANSICLGLPFLGKPTCQAPVLWMAYEESNSERAMILKMYDPTPPNLFITHEKVLLDDKAGLECLRTWIRKTGAKLLVIDPLYGAVKADSLADGRKARVALEGLKELCRTENVSAIVLHHFTKNVAAGSTRERFADSNQILATASMDLIMETKRNKDKTREIKLVGTGRGNFANYTYVIHSKHEAHYELIAEGLPEDLAAHFQLEQILEVLSKAPQGMTAVEIAAATGANEGTLRNRLTMLVKEQKIVVIGKRGKTKVYGCDQELMAA